MITKTILVLLYLLYSLIIHPTKIKTTKPIKNAEQTTENLGKIIDLKQRKEITYFHEFIITFSFSNYF